MICSGAVWRGKTGELETLMNSMFFQYFNLNFLISIAYVFCTLCEAEDTVTMYAK